MKILFFLVLLSVLAAGCVEDKYVKDEDAKISEHANELLDEYYQKINETVEINDNINNTYAGVIAPKEVYLDLKQKNEEFLRLGATAESYIKNNSNALDPVSYSDILIVIAENRGRAEMQNMFIDEIIKRYDNVSVKK